MLVSEIQSFEGETGLTKATEWRCPKEFGVGLNQSVSEADQGSVSTAWVSHNERKAVVRTESSVGAQVCERCQLNDMDVEPGQV